MGSEEKKVVDVAKPAPEKPKKVDQAIMKKVLRYFCRCECLFSWFHDLPRLIN
jgi:hypothetical protein